MYHGAWHELCLVQHVPSLMTMRYSFQICIDELHGFHNWFWGMNELFDP